MADRVFAEIGERIRAQRRKLGMTQEDVAEILGISATYYGEIERGNRKITIERLLLLRDRLDMDLNYLLTGEIIRGKELVEAFRDCPKSKVLLVDQIIRCLALLCQKDETVSWDTNS